MQSQRGTRRKTTPPGLSRSSLNWLPILIFHSQTGSHGRDRSGRAGRAPWGSAKSKAKPL